MLLAIDIGNTYINFGVFKAKGLARRFSIPTADYSIARLKDKLRRIKIDECIVCSVVPRLTRTMKNDSKRLLNKKPYVLGENINAPIRNLYRKPRQVGQDRLVNAYAGVRLYGAPLIVVDFGTALTLDAISRNREYLGGFILPGLNISLDALANRAALLPRIKLQSPREFIGRDTKNSMLSGVIYGFAALTDDLSRRISRRIGRNAKVIGTGGNIDLIKKYCNRIDKIDRDLTLKGLNLLFRNR
jgi:type III pantothenate kinase